MVSHRQQEQEDERCRKQRLDYTRESDIVGNAWLTGLQVVFLAIEAIIG